MPRFFAEVDFTQVESKNFVAEGSSTPPSVGTEVTGQLWNDTSLANNSVLKYWDGNEWVRMDGGGDIPNGMILDRHIAANAAIQWSKLAVPSNLATTESVNTAISAVTDPLDARLDTLEGSDAGQSVRQIAVSAINNAGLNGSFVDLTTAQTVGGVKTFSVSPVVPVATTATQAVQLSQLTAEHDRALAAEGANATAIAAEATRAEGIEAGLRTDLTAATDSASTLAGRVTTAESDIDALQANDAVQDAALATLNGTGAGSVTAAVAAETSRATGAENGLGSRITDEVTRATAAETANAGAVTTERNRAEAAEDLLDGRLDTVETTQAGEAARTTTAVNVERDRAEAAETGLDGRVTTLEGVDNFTQAEFTTFNTALTTSLAGKADLGSDGKVLASQLPSVRQGDVSVIDYVAGGFADSAAALASVTGEDEGDVAIINGGPGGTYIYTGTEWVPFASSGSSATDAEVAAAVSAEAALRAAADAGLQAAIDALAAIDNFTQAEADAEHTARLTAEAALQTALDNEATYRIAGDNAATSALTAEAASRTSGDAANAAAITAEATRATSAEDDLSGRITTEVADRTAADNLIRTDFASADTALRTDLTAEVTRATGAEGVLTTNLGAETTARGDADTALGGRIDGVVTSVTAEATRAGGVESGLRTDVNAATAAISTETSRAQSEESRIEGLITSYTSTGATQAYVDAADTAVRGEFAAADTTERNARIAGDAANATAVTDEAAARTAADTAVDARVTAEASTARAAELSLGGRIDSANSDLTSGLTAVRGEFAAADTAVRGEFAAADTSIRNDFGAADATLQTAIDTKAADADVVHKAGAETVTGVKTFSVNPQVPGGTGNTDAVNFGQISALVAAGAYDDTSVRGLITAAQSAADAAQADVDAFEATAGQANGLATLDSSGKVPIAQLPAMRTSDVSVVANIAARDALAGMDQGDVAVVTDADGAGTRQSFIYTGTAWVPLMSPADVTDDELAAAVAAGLTTVNARIDGLAAGAGMTRTGDTFNVIGTADRVTVTADAVDIAATYAGQASIVTVGTITSGTWNGSVVDLQHGGTGYAASDAGDLMDHLITASGLVIPSLGLYAETLTSMVSGTPFSVAHNLGGADVVVSLRQINGTRAGEVVFADVKVIDANHVTITVDPSHDETIDLRVTVIGGPVDSAGKIVGRSPGRIV